MRYRRLSFAVASEREEMLTALLWELGTLGLELAGEGAERRIDAWFAEPLAAPVLALAEGRQQAPGARLVEAAEVLEADWMAAYRRQAEPFAVGERLTVNPRDEALDDPGAEVAGGRLLLHLPARRAFGTGSHASTRLAVRALERLPIAGADVLDLGTGTGILAFAALAFGARRVVALDVDPAAVFAAASNAARNRLRPRLAAGGPQCLAPGARFELALINIRPEHYASQLCRLAVCLKRGAAAVFSGLLFAEIDSFAGRLEAHGLVARDRLVEDEWAALVARSER